MADSAQARVETTLLNRYRLERVLGSGGMATVYAATDALEKGRRVAVKVLHRHLAANADVRERFFREVYVANTIDHRGVSRVLGDGFDETSDARFVVLEYLEGETLEARRLGQGGRLTVDETLSILDSLLDVLEAAHRRRIVHRDVKPENVFLSVPGDELKVLDFGIAKLVELAGVTQSGEQLGTPAFMAPEQAGGRIREIDARTDIWAVGATAFTLLSGEYVHGTASNAAMTIRAATQHPRALARVAPAVPATVAELVDVALSFDRDARWPTAKMMQNYVKATRASLQPTGRGT